MAAVSPVGRAAGLEPLELRADTRAVGALYERHSQRVFAYCLSKLGRREDAEDAVQSTFLHAVRGLRRGVVPSVEIAWLLGIARNVCLSRFESAGRRGRLELVCDPVDLERSEAPEGRRDELIGLEQALARLPEQQRRAVLLRDWRGLSYEEVATQLGVTLANAETLIFRGRRTLADLLEEKPSTVRRHLAGLGNLGSLVSAIKTALTGGAAKLAAAAAVAAVSGAGVAAGTGAFSADRATPPGADAKTLRTPSGATRPHARPPAPVTPAGTEIAAAPRQQSTPSAGPAPVERETDAAAATPGRDADMATPPPTTASSPPADRSPVPAVKLPAPDTPGTIQGAVDQIVPDLPVSTPTLPEAVGSLPVPAVPPAVEQIVDAVPPVTAPPPVALIIADAPNLLP